MKRRIDLGYIHMTTWKKSQPLFPPTYTRPASISSKEVILPPNKTFNVTIDYPLDVPYEASLSTGKKGMTREEVILKIIKMYKLIYKEEERTSKIPAKLGKDGGNAVLMNRCQIDGKYGIWGHVLSDLVLHTAVVDEKQNTLTVDCDS